MKIEFAEIHMPTAGALVVGVLEKRVLSPTAAEVDARADGGLSRALEAGRFSGKKGQTVSLASPPGLELSRVVLVGLGKAAELDAVRLQEVGGALVKELNGLGETRAAIACDALEESPLSSGEIAANLAAGARLRAYRFDKYRTKDLEDSKPTLTALELMSEAPDAAREAFEPLRRVTDGVIFARDLVSEPSNVKFPDALAERLTGLADLGVDVEVLNETKMRELGMGSLLSVGQGSERESRLVVMSWSGAPGGEQKPIAFVGKGVTFDTGGISLKPSAGMEDMKYDMAGAGAVAGLIKALAGRKARVNVVGIVGLVENMPSGGASRPGDVVTSMSGRTIEIINTDAEGRLVLADALWYTQGRFKPRFMIDLATLTGAIIVALGGYQAGLFSNDDALAERIATAGSAVGEPVWRMPLGEKYDKDIDSEIADVKNVGKAREAGSTAAAQFLQRFVNDVPWAHLDIAGMAWTKKEQPVNPVGATGFGVRLLDRLVADGYES
ncbi:MAG: leucyl aminopeptidase [Proteobacteria bacterium]|nr:leucyl aminopeptidase [Pseudomonadota bacterium]